MGRKKINISVIEDTRQRTVTFARRRAGLIKKAHELSVLCGVRVGIVMFDTRDASHVYASSGTPDEIFARYLSKQFHTNESRKRKSVDKDAGTYGFENGSFVRRHLAVVNEYSVGPDGTGARNLSVKSNKQYHDPSKASMQASVSRVEPPVRSASLGKHKELLDPVQSLNLANNMDPLMLATQDLSSLAFLPDKAPDATSAAFGYSRDILSLIDEHRVCGGSPVSVESACGGSTAANSVYDPQLRYYEGCSEPVAKRVKAQTNSLLGAEIPTHEEGCSMLDQLLYDPELASILSNQWQNKQALQADGHICSSSSGYGDLEDEDDDDDDDDDEEEDDEGVEEYMDLEDDADDGDDDNANSDCTTVKDDMLNGKDSGSKVSASDNKQRTSLNHSADELHLLGNKTTSSSTELIPTVSVQVPAEPFPSLPTFTYPAAPPQLCNEADFQALASALANSFSTSMPDCPMSSITATQAPVFDFESLGIYQSNNPPMVSVPPPPPPPLSHDPSTIQQFYSSFTAKDHPIF